MHIRIRLAAWLLPLLGTGCLYAGAGRPFDPSAVTNDPGWILIEGVPLLRQLEEEDCGAAALAMVLRYWGVEADPATLYRELPTGDADGIEAGTLRACARSAGFSARLYAETWEGMTEHVGSDRPLLVGLVKPYRDGRNLLHYEVVVGLHPDRREVVTHDPARGRRIYPLDGFRREWEASGCLTLLVASVTQETDPG